MHNYIKIASQVIDTEIQGLEGIKENFNEVFIKLIDTILNMKGRVILSGMGKSGHIANKIASTLASTGTPAFCIHPGEASHGDLGMISKDDIVILLSNSGETKELMDIINHCKRFNITLVGLVRRFTSVLMETADIGIVLPEVKEASSINAPTTSTTMMLAFGDAVAVTLAETKGFTKEDFGVFHPGGKLGNQFLRVDSVMRKGNDLPVVPEDELMSNVIVKITNKAMGCACVVNKEGHLTGIITDGDLRRFMDNNILDKKAKDIMKNSPKTISPNALAVEVVNLMTEYKITTIFAVQDKAPVGAVHIHDCFKVGLI